MKKHFTLLLLFSLSLQAMEYKNLIGYWSIEPYEERSTVSFGMQNSYNEPIGVEFEYHDRVKYAHYKHYYLLINNKLEISKYPPKNGSFRTKKSNDIYGIGSRIPEYKVGGRYCFELSILQKGIASVYDRDKKLKMCQY